MRPVLVLELLAPDLRAHARPQHVEVARLGDVVVGAGAETLDHRCAILDRGQHDDGNVAHARRGLDAPAGLLAADARHQQVEQNAVDRLDGEQLERLLAGAGENHLVAVRAQGVGELLQIGVAVVDREHLLRAEQARRRSGLAVVLPALRSMALSRARMTLDVLVLAHEGVGAGIERAQLGAAVVRRGQQQAGQPAQRRVEPDAADDGGAVDAGQHARRR